MKACASRSAKVAAPSAPASYQASSSKGKEQAWRDAPGLIY
jgi:hypothetical protein